MKDCGRVVPGRCVTKNKFFSNKSGIHPTPQPSFLTIRRPPPHSSLTAAHFAQEVLDNRGRGQRTTAPQVGIDVDVSPM